jgi:hypothetical protein
MDNIAPGKGGVPRDPATLASHHMPGGDLEMLKGCLRLRVKLRRDKDFLQIDVETVATNVGHRVPTGFVDRNLCLVVEALAANGSRVAPLNGPRLPELAGVGDPAKGNLAGLPGRFHAKQLADPQGRSPVAFWQPNQEQADTRLIPDQPDRTSWNFAADRVQRVRIRLIYRRFFKAVADHKGWPDNEIIVVDQFLDPPAPGREVTWRSSSPK